MSEIRPVPTPADPPAGGWQPVSTPEVTEAADRIEENLDGSGVFNVVSANEVREIGNELADLDAQVADSVIDELDRRGLLDDFARQVVDRSVLGVGGGLSPTDRETLFENFAKQLDAESLVAVSDAFAGTSDGIDGYDRVQGLASAIAEHSSDGTKVAFVEAMADPSGGRLTDQPQQDSNWVAFGGRTTVVGDADARAVAMVIASLGQNGDEVANALGHLSNADLQAVVDASVDQTMHQTTRFSDQGGAAPPSVTHSFAVGAFDELAASVTNIDNPAYAAEKARFFDAAGVRLGDVSNTGDLNNPAPDRDQTVNQMTESLTVVLDTDVNGIVQALANDADTLSGDGLANYARAMLESGQEDVLGEQLVELALGDGQTPAVERFEYERPLPGRPEDTQRPVAAAIGYFTGAISAAAQSIASDQQGQNDITTAVLRAALTAIDKFEIGGRGVSTTAAISREAVRFGVEAALARAEADEGRTRLLEVIPQDADGVLQVSSDALNTMHTSFDFVEDSADV